MHHAAEEWQQGAGAKGPTRASRTMARCRRCRACRGEVQRTVSLAFTQKNVGALHKNHKTRARKDDRLHPSKVACKRATLAAIGVSGPTVQGVPIQALHRRHQTRFGPVKERPLGRACTKSQHIRKRGFVSALESAKHRAIGWSRTVPKLIGRKQRLAWAAMRLHEPSGNLSLSLERRPACGELASPHRVGARGERISATRRGWSWWSHLCPLNPC
mmetsp:Transcript_25193/g.57202  ORF Transcript_25193/g.57202 Transcript_25193/m.57202 type:complete len:216 (+) Transcript_25193:210-857(+)